MKTADQILAALARDREQGDGSGGADSVGTRYMRRISNSGTCKALLERSGRRQASDA